MGNIISSKLKKMIQVGYWPGFIVGMYPSQFAYKPINIDWDKMWDDTNEINLYYHIPFCKFKCSYCTFFSIRKDDTDYFERYIDKVNKQFDFYNKMFKQKITIKSICFGGGTPNILSVDLYNKIFDTLSKGNVIFDKDLEPSMEISPEIITEEYIKGLSILGIRRVSLGVQSLKSDLRASINREKTLNISDVLGKIREHNLNINIDLINGLVGQDKESFMDTLKEITKFSPETISIYPLSGANNSLFKTNDLLMSTKEKYELFDIFHEYLLENGYYCESHVKFVKCNQKSTHQQKIYEYNGVETLGLGCGARTYNSNLHYALPWIKDSCDAKKSIDEYIKSEFEKLSWVGFKMTEEENKRRFIIYSFFIGELNTNTYSNKFKTSILDDFKDEINALFENDLIEKKDDSKIMLTKKGRKYTDLIGTLFWSEKVNGLFRNAWCFC